METETTTARMDSGVPVGTDGARLLQQALETVMVPCPHCEVRTVPAATPGWLTEPCAACKRDRKPDRTDTLCQCRLPDCGQCTELVDTAQRAERLPRYPR